jgi:DNA-binding IclR family transcriptional regulator
MPCRLRSGPTVVRLEEPSHPVHIAMRVGSTVSLLETATGRIFAAFLPPATINAALDEELDRLSIGYDPKRTTRGPAVEKILADVRARGLARAVGEPLRGVNAFAAPVFDHSGAVILAVTAMGAVGTFDVGWNSPIAKALLTCTNAISRRLGHAVRS